MLQITNLEQDEIQDPYLVLFRFFDYAGIDRQREHLWECLKTTVSGTFSTELLSKRKRHDMIYFFEHLAKLIEAAYLINKQRLHKSGNEITVPGTNS